jgi:hypothetical protein
VTILSDRRPRDPLDRIECASRRFQRFFGSGGLVEKFEQIGYLVQFGDVAEWLGVHVPGIARADAIKLFVLAARHGELGWRDYGERRAVAELIDLDGHEFDPGQYPLRPSALTVEMRPASIRARRSVWARWLKSQGWPVPSWLAIGDAGADQQPDAVNGDQQPDDTGADQQPDAVNGDQQPDDADGNQRPDAVNGDQQPDNTGADQQPDAVNGDQQPDDVEWANAPPEWRAGKAEAFRWLEDEGVPPPGDRGNSKKFWQHMAEWFATKHDFHHRHDRTFRRWCTRYISAYEAGRRGSSSPQ